LPSPLPPPPVPSPPVPGSTIGSNGDIMGSPPGCGFVITTVPGGRVMVVPGSTVTTSPGGIGNHDPSGFLITVSSGSDQVYSLPPLLPSGAGR